MLLSACSAPPTSAPQVEQGFRPVFDPQTLVGVAHEDGRAPEGWIVENDALKHTGGEPLHANLGAQDFELTCQWKTEGTTQPRIDVLVGPNARARTEAQAAQRILNYDVQLPNAPKPLAAGSWNEVRVRVVGANVSMWLNGVSSAPDAKIAAGVKHVRFEGGADPVWFQNVLTREVAGTDGLPPDAQPEIPPSVND